MYDKVEVGQRMEMPKEHEKMKFMHHFKEEKFPFVIYADLKGLTVPRDNPPRSEFKTEIYHVHTPCGNMMNAVNSIENTSEQYLHRGEEGMDNFCLKLNEIRAEVEEMMKYNEPIDMSAVDERHFKNASHCCICGDKFKSTLKNKVRDHCHFTGRYSGCTHPICNLN